MTFKAAARVLPALAVVLLLAVPARAAAAGPTVETIEPPEGPASGGTPVVIKGTGFQEGSTVTIGGTPVLVANRASEGLIEAVTPPGSGEAEVVVTDGEGSSTGGPKFKYLPVPPTVESIEPPEGPASGGTKITIKGTGFQEGSTVTIGGALAVVANRASEGLIEAVTPPGSGEAEVVVTDGEGSSTGGPKFKYLPVPPTVESIEPPEGPASGGTKITIKGTGFLPGATVMIGGAEASEVNVVSKKEITAKTPHGTGAQEVVVKYEGGSSTGGPIYTYLPAPTVETAPATAITQTTATLNASVNPNGVAVTACVVEYGTTTAYGSTAPCTPEPGSEAGPVAVSAAVSGLSENTTYHFRITATGAGGTARGADETFATLAPVSLPGPPFTAGEINQASTTRPGLPRPVLGRSVNIVAGRGRVALRTPGSARFVALSGARQVPFGTVVEATKGEVGVTAATPAGGLWAGRFFDGKFVLTQARNGTVMATLAGGNFSVCSRRAHAGRNSKRALAGHLVRRLWAETGGNFSTKGRYAEGIVQGAQWLTEDLCEGTLVLATRDRVQVAELRSGRQVQVPAGHIDIVKPR